VEEGRGGEDMAWDFSTAPERAGDTAGSDPALLED
jgi:hypothetical protein